MKILIMNLLEMNANLMIIILLNHLILVGFSLKDQEWGILQLNIK